MLPMYDGMVNSPTTKLSADVDATQTTIDVVDGTKLPPAPNLAVIGLGEDAETILYASKEGNTLSGITRGFQGTAKVWSAGTPVARLFTEYDWRSIKENFDEHLAEIATTTLFGHVKVDGTTITATDGVISAIGGGGGPVAATLVVAASNSSQRGKDLADYVCDGVSDQVEINNALAALGAVGGCVLLLEGTYIVDGPINVPSNATLAGQGWGTIIKIKDALNANINVVQNADQTNGNTRIVLRDFTIDGNKANNTTGTQHGIYLSKTTYPSVSRLLVSNCRTNGIYLRESSNSTVTGNICWGQAYYGIFLNYGSGNVVVGNICHQNGRSGIQLGDTSGNVVTGNTCRESPYYGIYLTNCSYNTIAGNTCLANKTDIQGDGIYLTSSTNNTVTGNTCQGSGCSGIFLYSSSLNTLTGNTCVGNNHGVYPNASSQNTIAGNTCRSNNRFGIYLYASSNNTVTGNTCLENSQAANATYDNIYIGGDSDYNNVQANTCRAGILTNKPRYGIYIGTADCDGNLVTNNDLYQGGATGAFSDAGTGTVTAAGNRLA